MADSKSKKTTPATSTTKKAASKPATTNKATAKKTAVAKTTADGKKTTTAKAASQPKSNNAVEKKAPSKSTAKTSTAPAKTVEAKKEKRRGGGMAFLALLCSLGALGLSGYNYYLQNLSPQSKQSQDVLLQGVNDIKTNVTEFGSVVSELQEDVQSFKASQAEYITKDTLATAVKEGVDNAVQSLPELPSIGPKPLEQDQGNQNLISETEQLEQQDNSAVSTVPSAYTKIEANNTEGENRQDSSQVNDVQASAEKTGLPTTTEGEKQLPEVVEKEEDSFWSWGRAKQDMKDMLKSFVKIEKTEQN